MKKTRYIIALVLACIMLLSLTACGGGGETAPETSEPGAATTDPSGGETTDPDVEKKEFNIAMILQTLSNPFYVDMEKGANERVAEYENEGISITLEISAPQKETDSEAVVDFFANAITKQVDAICIVPGDTQSIIPSLLDANAAGIPVVTIDSKLDGEIMEKENAEIVAWVGSDNIEGGRIAGRAMGELFKDEEGTVEIAVIEGIAGHTTAEGRKQGFGEGLAEYSNCEIVSSQTADWDQEKAYRVFQNVLTAHPNVKGVFGASDLMAVGAIQAIEAANKTGQIKVIGFDYHESAQAAISEGTMVGSVAQYPAEMGAKAIEIAIGKLTNPDFTTDAEVYTTVELLTD